MKTFLPLIVAVARNENDSGCGISSNVSTYVSLVEPALDN